MRPQDSVSQSLLREPTHLKMPTGPSKSKTMRMGKVFLSGFQMRMPKCPLEPLETLSFKLFALHLSFVGHLSCKRMPDLQSFVVHCHSFERLLLQIGTVLFELYYLLGVSCFCESSLSSSSARYPSLSPSRKPTTKLPANGKIEITPMSHEKAVSPQPSRPANPFHSEP